MIICEYGCGREAKYPPHKGTTKWCCEKIWNLCPNSRLKNKQRNLGKKLTIESRKKISNANRGRKAWNKGISPTQEVRDKISRANKGHSFNLGKKHSEETKQKIGAAVKGFKHSIETRERISSILKGKKRTKPAWNKGKTNVYSTETIKQMSESKKGKIAWNKGKTNIYSLETIQKIKNSLKHKIEDIQSKYITFTREEEMRYNPEQPGEIQVHCKNNNCLNSKEKGGWFTPTENQFDGRRRALEDPQGNDGMYFYCSEQCKNECPLYYLRGDPLNNKEPLYTSEDYNIWRQEVLRRANNECQYCGKEATDCHHIQPQKLEPIYVLDPDNGIACCEECHYKYGHETGTECSTGNLANKICK